jgi:hypothetical protein
MNFCDAEMRVSCAERLARIEQMLKDRMEQSKEDRQRFEDLLMRHEHRIVSLEKWRNWVLGFGAVCVSVALGFWQWIKNHIQFQP